MAPGKPCSLCGLLTNKSWISLISCLKIKIQTGRGGTIPDTADCCWLSCFKYFIADRIQWNINLRGPAGFMQPLSPRIKLRTTQSIFAKSHIMGQWILSTWIREDKRSRDKSISGYWECHIQFWGTVSVVPPTFSSHVFLNSRWLKQKSVGHKCVCDNSDLNFQGL